MSALTIGFSLAAGACGDASVPVEAELEPVGVTQEALEGGYCSSPLDCPLGCVCSSNACIPDGFGPPAESCSVPPPPRPCSTASHCQSGCECSGGVCQPDGFSPPSEFCHRPPPDAYENDDSSSSASSYLGSPQVNHTFDDPYDQDWVVVYFGVAMQARFETYNMIGGANTYLKVYTYNPATGSPGALVGSSSDVCNDWNNPQCRASKVTLNVPAVSAYFVRVSSSNGAYDFFANPTLGYSFRIY